MFLLLEYIKKYKSTYIGITIIFAIGIIIGGFLILKTSSEEKEEIKTYVIEAKEILVENKENKHEIFLNSFWQNIKLTLIIWLLGCTIIAGFAIYIIILYKGLTLGYIISIIINLFGLKQGIIFLCTLLLCQNIIFLPSLFLLATSGVRLYKGIIKKEANLKYELIRHSVILIVVIGVVIISGCVNAYVLPIFL